MRYRQGEQMGLAFQDGLHVFLNTYFVELQQLILLSFGQPSFPQQNMQILQIDRANTKTLNRGRATWKEQFIKNLYHNSFMHWVEPSGSHPSEPDPNVGVEGTHRLVLFIKGRPYDYHGRSMQGNYKQMGIKEQEGEGCKTKKMGGYNDERRGYNDERRGYNDERRGYNDEQRKCRTQSVSVTDRQPHNPHYSPYSIYIPLKTQSFLTDEVINTFPYAKHLHDNRKPAQIQKMERNLQKDLAFDSKKVPLDMGLANQMNKWLSLKRKYLCRLDAVTAVQIFLLIKKAGLGQPVKMHHQPCNQDDGEFQISHPLFNKDNDGEPTINHQLYNKYDDGEPKITHQLYHKYDGECKKQVFYQRVFRTVMYLRPVNRMHANIPISIQICDPIDEKTVPSVMKTWYCSICLIYDCQRHIKDNRVMNKTFDYVSPNNLKSPLEHVRKIAGIIKFNQNLKKMMMGQEGGDSSHPMHSMLEEDPIDPGDCCSESCYKRMRKEEDVKRVSMMRGQLISPLAASMLKLGIQMFSYDPCLIHTLFSAKAGGSDSSNKGIPSISCSLIFLHLAVESDLLGRIGEKFMGSESEHLLNEKMSEEIMKVAGTVKPSKKMKEKMESNDEPESAMCFHYIVGKNPVDHRCGECVCRKRGFCIPSCLCTPFCDLRREGCRCQDSCQNEKCFCFVNDLECEPGLCLGCFPTQLDSKKNSCRNVKVLRGWGKKMVVGLSLIPGAGLGCFANENYSKSDLISIYSGENISMEMDQVRECMITDLSFYNFDSPNHRRIEASIDARYKGNKARFINHCNNGSQNLQSKTIYTNGSYYIGLYAVRDTLAGEELTFNYDGNGKLFSNFHDKYPFIHPPKKK